MHTHQESSDPVATIGLDIRPTPKGPTRRACPRALVASASDQAAGGVLGQELGAGDRADVKVVRHRLSMKCTVDTPLCGQRRLPARASSPARH